MGGEVVDDEVAEVVCPRGGLFLGGMVDLTKLL
jgi:hypothetical protein